MIRDWSVDRVMAECRRMHHGATDPYVTGWNNWPCKQDLYRVKFAVEQMLAATPQFADEAEWLEQQRIESEKQQIWKAISEVQHMR